MPAKVLAERSVGVAEWTPAAHVAKRVTDPMRGVSPSAGAVSWRFLPKVIDGMTRSEAERGLRTERSVAEGDSVVGRKQEPKRSGRTVDFGRRSGVRASHRGLRSEV
jgi:hypothetical protein